MKSQTAGFIPLEKTVNFSQLSVKRRNSLTGFTVLEIVIAVAVVAIVASIVIGQAATFRRQAALSTESERLITLLAKARTDTLASLNSLNYGVYFAPNTVTIFSGESYVAGAEGNEVIDLDPSVEIIAVDLSGSQVVFERLTGASNAGTVTLALANDSTQTREIIIAPSGISSLGQ